MKFVNDTVCANIYVYITMYIGHICTIWLGGMVGWGDPPVGAYDMHGPNTDYGIIQPYHGILQPAPRLFIYTTNANT